MYRAPLRSTISPPRFWLLALTNRPPLISRYSHLVSCKCVKPLWILVTTSSADIVHFNSIISTLFSSTSFCRLFPFGTVDDEFLGITITFTFMGLILLPFFFFCAGRATQSSKGSNTSGRFRGTVLLAGNIFASFLTQVPLGLATRLREPNAFEVILSDWV